MYEYSSSPKTNSSDVASAEKFLVCINGCAHASASTFEQAFEIAQKMDTFSEDNSFSVYEIDTRIHFDVMKYDGVIFE
jgi:hypothetical protein